MPLSLAGEAPDPLFKPSFEHASSQFAVDATFDSFSALKHSCTRAALLDVYEFLTVKSDSRRYTLKCKDEDCDWYLSQHWQ
jgi:hypothetical protein